MNFILRIPSTCLSYSRKIKISFKLHVSMRSDYHVYDKDIYTNDKIHHLNIDKTANYF